MQSHVWRHARVDRISALAGPIAVRLERGEILGVCGDGFGFDGGVEGAYRSGWALAARIGSMIGKQLSIEP